MKNLNVLPDLTGKSAIIFERMWFADESQYLKNSDIYYILAIDRKIYLKDNWIFTSMQGASMSASLAERLIRTGVNKIIRIGTTGSLKTEIGLYELILPVAIVKDEGASNQYVFNSFPCICDINLLQKVENILQETSYKFHRGIGWTTDGRWIESLEKMHKLVEWNVLGVDMETSGIYTVCQLHKIPSVALNIVTDYPLKSEKDGLKGIPLNYKDYKKNLILHVNNIIKILVQNIS